jgi:ATP synthase subunit 6
VRDLLHPRVLLVLAILIGACFANTKLIAHHQSESPFTQLFMHLQPEKLITGGGHGHDDHAGEEHAGEVHAGEEHAHAAYLLATPTLPLPAIFDMDAAHEGTQLVATNLQIFQIASILLIFVCLTGIPKYLRTGQGDAVTRLFTGFCLWVRDEVVYPVMGEKLGARWAPYFLAVFFFIMFMNLGGLLPHSATPTASIFITGALAMLTLLSMLVFGMVVQGPVAFWKNLVPHVPIFIWPLMFVVEVVGLIIKPVALMLRLFATMTGGHLVVLSFIGILFFFAAEFGSAAGYGVGLGLSVPFAVFVMIIESFVALLQAYIFTQLSVIFINMAIHPEH